jgi:LmbE family N-acetylglucosaminyl deacetylase
MKSLVCVFAHPDDEAFGPSGTIAKEALLRDVYLICVTDGGAYGDTKLAKIRKEEIQASANILGIKKIFFLGFKDGSLNNNLYHDLAGKIEKIIKDLRPDTILTYEPHGVSGHIDHIAVSLVTTYVFQKLRFVKTLLYHCLPEWQTKFQRGYFIYFPPGYKKDEIDRVEDVKDVWSKKIEAIKAHKSQAKDGKAILGFMHLIPKKEYFLVLKK